MKKIDPVGFGKSRYSFIELSKQSEDISQFTETLREEHMKRIGQMQNYVINFAQENMQHEHANQVEATAKKYLLRLKTNVAELNRKFTRQYNTCKENLGLFSSECKSPVEKQQAELKYNNKYIKSLHDIDTTIEKTIVSLHKSSISKSVKQMHQLCHKSSIVDVFNSVAKKLSSHFNLVSDEKIAKQIKEIDVKNDKQVDSFLEKVILRIHHDKLLVPKAESAAEKKERELKEKFVKERSEFAQILYNKAVTYMSNAVQRKKKLSAIESELFDKMKKNDVDIDTEAKDLENMRKSNAELIVSLNRDSDAARGNIKRCEVLTNITIKCKEMANIYQNIISSYDEQSQSLDRIFKLLKK